MIQNGHKENLAAIYRAAENGDLGLVIARDAEMDKEVVLLIAISEHDNIFDITPLALMFSDFNPFERFTLTLEEQDDSH